MIINVTQEDIDNGCQFGASCCPIAKALLRQVPNITSCAVSGKVIDLFYKRDGVWHTTHNTPNAAAEFIVEYDNQRPVFPFTFEFDLTPVHSSFWDAERRRSIRM